MGANFMSEKEVKDKRHKHTSELMVYEMTKEIEIQCFVEQQFKEDRTAHLSEELGKEICRQQDRQSQGYIHTTHTHTT